MVCRGYWHFNGPAHVLVTKGACEVLDVFNVIGSPVEWHGKRTRGGTVMIVGSHIIIYSRDQAADSAFFVKFSGYRMLMRAVVG
jgi:hypothetical protein